MTATDTTTNSASCGLRFLSGDMTWPDRLASKTAPKQSGTDVCSMGEKKIICMCAVQVSPLDVDMVVMGMVLIHFISVQPTNRPEVPRFEKCFGGLLFKVPLL